MKALTVRVTSPTPFPRPGWFRVLYSQCPHFTPGSGKWPGQGGGETGSAQGFVVWIAGHHIRAAVGPPYRLPLFSLGLTRRQQPPVLLGHLMPERAAVGGAEDGAELSGCPHEPLGGIFPGHGCPFLGRKTIVPVYANN